MHTSPRRWFRCTMPQPKTLTRRSLLKATIRAGIGSCGLAAGGIFYAHKIEGGWVEVVQRAITLPRLAPEFDGYQLVHISDLHLGDWLTPIQLHHVVTLVNQQQPDAVAITGDFVTTRLGQPGEDLSLALQRLNPRDAVVAVLGNHDHWSDAGQVCKVLKRSGVSHIGNTAQTLRRGKARLHLAGVDDPWMKMDRMDAVLPQLGKDGAAVLLAHEPDFADEYAQTGRFDLQLSGHSHGGQVIPPFGRPVVVPPYARKYPIGAYKVGTMTVYTNRGIGMVKPHIRFNCRPEITVFTLRAPLPT